MEKEEKKIIICECCTNWDDLKMAKHMIATAKENGAGLVKFQLFNAEDDKGKPHYEWVKEHELTFDQAKELFDYGASIDQEVFFSVFHVKHVDWCEKIGVEHIKLSSSVYDLRIIKAVDYSGIFYISSLPRELFINPRNGDSFLYCPPGYPQSIESLNFRHFINEDNRKYKGFSDHTIGIDAARIALARGAKIIEKHFVLYHNSSYPDDLWSMNIHELRELVRFDKVCNEVL